MKKQNLLRNDEGFTLVEIIAVLIILGILAAVAVPRYIDLENSARERGLDAAIAEMNGRESLTWAAVKISQSGWLADTNVTDQLNSLGHYDLGTDYVWSSVPPGASATLTFQGVAVANLTRAASTTTTPGNWVRN